MIENQTHRGPPFTILCLEADPLDYECIRTHLSKEGFLCKAERTDSEASFREALEKARFDVILCDYNLPGFDGIKALSIARSLACDTPVLFVSGAMGEDIAIESLKQGAVDYVTKQNLSRLATAIRRALQEAQEKRARRLAEAELRKAQSRFQLVLEATSDGLWDWDIVQDTLTWSDRFKELLGYPPDWPITFEKIQDLIHPEDNERVAQLLSDYLEKRIPAYSHTFRILHADGAYRWMHSRGKASWDEHGKPIRMAGGATDITERKEASHALAKSEKHWRTLTEAMPQLVWIDRGSDGYCEYLSSQWMEFSGIPVDKLLGFAWLKLVHPEDESRTAEAWAEAVAGRADYNIEYRLRRHDGQYRWFKVRGVPLRDAQGAISVWYGTCTEIHELKLAEARAEAANKAKSEFLANMSHEIRTPMNAVIGLSTILTMMPDLNAKQTEIVNTLQMSAQSLLGLINDLLDISKIETNMIEIERIAFMLEEVLSEIISISALKAQEKHIELSYEPSDTAKKTFWGDPTRIRQVLMNLVSNGIKFTEKGSVMLMLDDAPHEKAHFRQVRIHVSDSGIGIAPEKIATIFDKFTQADSSTTRKYGGTGLGLAISKNLAEIMGGAITVESRPGAGTRFTFCIPLEIVAPSERERAAPEKPPPASPSSEYKGRILLVEDHAPNVMVAQHILENLGFTCEIAGNGREAVAKLSQSRERFCAVLMDVQMPEMDGLEAARLIRRREAQENLPAIPIIAMTAHALQDDKERCLNAGMNAYIAKPFQAQTLEETLRSYCKPI